MSKDPVFVRPALVTHAPYIGALHSQAMRSVLAEALPDSDVVELVDEQAITDGWVSTLALPAQSGQGVYVATEIDTPRGFVAFTSAPAESGDGRSATEILALEVEDEARRKGHGSRMLAAVSDLAREADSVHLQVWLSGADTDKIRFFESAGFAPSGLRRTLDAEGHPLVEHLWYATLT